MSWYAEISGIKPHEMYSLPKLMWLRGNKPDIFARARRVFLMEDFVVIHHTGQAKIDYSLATRTMERTGLSKSARIVCISHDQIAPAVGTGVFISDIAVDGEWTDECITHI